LEVLQPFYAFRGLVVASPVWYPNISMATRKKLSEEQIEAVRNLASYKKRRNLKNINDKTGTVRILNMLVEPEMLEQFLSV